jgi:proteic killer suppression protein
MIKNFKSLLAQDIFDGIESRSTRRVPVELHSKARRLFDQINAATKVETLQVPRGNHLEKLKGNLRDYWSIRINKQWRGIRY